MSALVPIEPSPVIQPLEIQSLRSICDGIKAPFFATGSLPIESGNTTSLWIPGKDSNTYSIVRFPVDSDVGLKPLTDACKQAPFGRGKEEVLDPSYRRALVLQANEFVFGTGWPLDPYARGIVTSIEEGLFFGDPKLTGRRIVAKLDKLNVYSEGDFFKPHKDTPLSSDMFGTLLINLPVRHTGGKLVVRAPEAKTGESSASRRSYSTRWGNITEAGWIAFYSDCEHEVFPVTSGHRVTLSYSLTLEGRSIQRQPLNPEHFGGMTDVQRRRLTSALLAPGVFTSERTHLCFFLQHEYPIASGRSRAKSARRMLKGQDAVIYHALKVAHLLVTFHFVTYEVDPDDDEREEVYKGDIAGKEEIALILPPDKTVDSTYGNHDDTTVQEIMRYSEGAQTLEDAGIVQVTSNGPRHSPMRYGEYGNSPMIATEYAAICMVAATPESWQWNRNEYASYDDWSDDIEEKSDKYDED